MDSLALSRHIYAVQTVGYTRIESQVTGAWLDELRCLTDASLAAAMKIYRERGSLSHCSLGEGYEAARCVYCWGEPAMRLLDHEIIHALAAGLLGAYRLWDLSALAVVPRSTQSPTPPPSFHRDRSIVDTRTAKPPFLWCFLALDDTTVENGATWVVPGTHHIELRPKVGGEEFRKLIEPMSLRACAKAGDLIVLDPTMLHAAGINQTNKPRRLLNVALCLDTVRPLLDTWTIAGPAIHARASGRVRDLMQGGEGLDQTWDSLPPEWKTGKS